MRRSATYALFAVVTALTAAPTHAQSIPEGQSCGGLLCDMGVFGHKTAPAAPPPIATPAPQADRRAEAVPAEPREPTSEPRKRTVVRKKRTAKAVPAPAVGTPAPATAAPTPSTLAAAPAKPAAPIRATQARAVPAQPPASAASVSMNPFIQTGPASVPFRPLY